MIPVAKSTEILYLNETDWETFAGETGADKEMLKTWEGLAQAAGMYYEWSGGSPFLGMNAFNDFAALSAAQLGEGIRWTQDGPEFNYSRDTARRVMDDILCTPYKAGTRAEPTTRTALKAEG